jgi:glycyl-tRNA synthetase
MELLYDKNGLIFWSEREIRQRRHFEEQCTFTLFELFKRLNPAFEFVQVEAPQLMPAEHLSGAYTSEDVYQVDDLVLRPETTLGSYLAAEQLLNKHNDRKVRLPLVVWQHGKSFRKEKDKVLKHMRLKEFYQLEFQVLFSSTTKRDYYPDIANAVVDIIDRNVGPCRLEKSDSLPAYSESTMDVVMLHNGMEICSISQRKDCPFANNIEIAIGTDRCVYNS